MDIKYQNKTPGIVKAIQVRMPAAAAAEQEPMDACGGLAAGSRSRRAELPSRVCCMRVMPRRPPPCMPQAAEGDTVTVGQAFAVVEENADAAASTPAPKAEAAAAPAAPAPEAPKQAAAAPAAPPPPKPAAAAAPKAAAAAAPPAPPAPGQRPERRVPMTRLRRRVAERLKGAQNTYAMLSTFNEVDMTAVMEMRRELKVGLARAALGCTGWLAGGRGAWLEARSCWGCGTAAAWLSGGESGAAVGL